MNSDLDLIVSALMSVIQGVGGGTVLTPIIFGAIEIFDGVFHFSANQKRTLAVGMAFALPMAAYGLLLLLTGAEPSGLTLLIAGASGVAGAVKLHDFLEKQPQSGTGQGEV